MNPSCGCAPQEKAAAGFSADFSEIQVRPDQAAREDQDGLRRSRTAGADLAAATAPPIVDEVLGSSGHPLPAPVRTDMESHLHHDFSSVRIHTDARAGRSARAVSARAYTVGQQVVFGSGEYQPATSAGRSLIAHELVHTVQQRGQGHIAHQPLTVGPAHDAYEREAEALAGHATACAPSAGSANQTLQRLGDVSKVPPDLTCTVASSTPGSVFSSIPFAQGAAAVGPTEEVELGNVITAWHAAGSSPTIRVDGYASTEGRDEDNWRLSCARAQAVFAELTARPTGPTIPATNVELFAQGETNEFGVALPPNRRVSISTPSPLPAPVCTHPGSSRTLDVQPVFLRTDATDLAPTGDSWDRRLATANAIWGKVGVHFNGLSPVTIDTNLKTSADVVAIAALRASAGVQVFLVDNDLAGHGGAATLCPPGAGPCCSAPMVMSDRGTSNTILAHELGHVIGLDHPGVLPNPGDTGTIMQGSGSHSTANPTRNTMVNFNAILCPPATGSTCLAPDP